MVKYLIRFIFWFKKKIRKISGDLKFLFYKIIFNHVTYGRNIKVNGIFYLNLKGDVKIGDNIKFNNHTVFNFAGINRPTSISVSKDASLIIGDNCGFSGTAIYCSEQIIIGKNCLFGVNTFIWDTDFHDINRRFPDDVNNTKSKPIIIQDNVFIGANTTILKGVTIGEGAVIGANSVITIDIEAFTINAGSPCKMVKKY
jgi:acetyltransferase-like isoleucine patch superfamily enzyme